MTERQLTTAEVFGQEMLCNSYTDTDLYQDADVKGRIIQTARHQVHDKPHDVMNNLNFWSNIYTGILGEGNEQLAAIYAFTQTMSANEAPI